MDSPFEVISQAGVLTTQEWGQLESLRGELLQTWETAQIFRTRTEMDVSVLKDIRFATPDAKYWQAVREQNVQFQELVMLSFDYRKTVLEARKLERDQGKEADDLEQEIMQVEIDRKRFVAQNMERTAKERLREILEWTDIKKKLRPLLKYGDQDVNAHQWEALRLRFEYEAKLVNEHTQPADARNILGIYKMTHPDGA